MTRYEFLLFVHVLAAAAWFGAALYALALMELAGRARDNETVLRLGEYDDRVAKTVFIPSALITLAAGVALVLDGPWGFVDDGWVAGGLILFAALFVLGVAIILPAAKKLEELARDGAATSTVEAQIGRVRMLSRIDVVLLAAAIFLMTTKPF